MSLRVANLVALFVALLGHDSFELESEANFAEAACQERGAAHSIYFDSVPCVGSFKASERYQSL